MHRSIRYYSLVVLLPTAAVACLVGLAVGLWCLVGQASVGALLARGFLAILGVGMLALIPAVLLAHVLVRSIEGIQSDLNQIREGKTTGRPVDKGSLELHQLSETVRELGVSLQERRQDERERQRMQARELREESLKRFALGVARESQKPMAGVIGFVEMAMRQPMVDGQLKNFLTLALQEARSGREALDDVLRFARDDSFATEPLDLNVLLDRVSRGMREEGESRGRKVKLNLGQSLPRVLGEAGQLQFVFTCLLENAWDALPEQGGTIEISTNENASGWVVVMVKDNGHGIPETDQPKVFTPFFTTKGTRRGAGLKLATSASIVRRHGGTMDFFSVENKSTVFFVNLPPEGGQKATG